MLKTPQSLRQAIAALDAEGQLLTFDEEVALEPDLSAAAQAGQNLSTRSPALLFNKLQGYPGHRVALNMMASWPNHALSFGLPGDTPLISIYDEVRRRWVEAPRRLDRREDAPFLSHVYEGEAINLYEIMPLFRVNERDGGPYITKSALISRDITDPDNEDKENAAMYRIQVKGKNLLAGQFIPGHDCATHLRLAEERGENLKVALAVGLPPSLVISSATPLAYDQSEFKLAAAFQEAPFAVYRSDHSGVNLPWHAEYILEGEILSREREPEGPFGEFTGFYCGNRKMPLIRVTRVMHRPRPIFENLHISRPMNEEDYITAFNNGISIHEEMCTNFPGVRAVNAINGYGLTAIISMEASLGGMAKAAALRAMTTVHGSITAKTVIVVDADVDPFDMDQVFWALSVNMNPKFDVAIIPGLPVAGLDPGSDPAGITSKMIIDATKPKAPDVRGRYGRMIEQPTGTKTWEKVLLSRIKANKEGSA